MSHDHNTTKKTTQPIEQARDWTVRSDAMPSEMQILLAEYPREVWEAHPGFKELTKQWLGAHQMFRRLSKTVRVDGQRFLDGKLDALEYSQKLSYRGGALVNNLHGHHGWEDHSYFPELSAADSRFDAGLAILEKDHQTLHLVLDSFTELANKVIGLHAENKSAFNEVGELHKDASIIELLLQRHLSDEEELAVPIILHHRLRG